MPPITCNNNDNKGFSQKPQVVVVCVPSSSAWFHVVAVGESTAILGAALHGYCTWSYAVS
jgi:hypothetical protein